MRGFRLVPLGLALAGLMALCTCRGGDDRRPKKKPPDPLMPPTGLAAVPGDARVTITFIPVAGATSYTLYHGTSPGITKAHATISGLVSPYVHTGLVNGTTYYYAITASRDAEESDLSAEVSARPDVILPDPPTGVIAMASDGQVTVVHDPVPGATSYNLYYDTDPGVTKADSAILAVPSPFVHTGLTNGTTYYYRLSTVQGALEGSLSMEVQAIPQGGPPGPPRSVGAHGGDADGAITIHFLPGAGAATHHAYFSTSPGVTTADTKIPDVLSPHLHTGLVNGTTYYYRLTAENPLGESVLSAETSAVALAVPTCSEGRVEIDGNMVEFASVIHTYDTLYAEIVIEMTDSTPPDWSLTMKIASPDESPGMVDSCERPVIVDVIDPQGDWFVENMCTHDVLVTITRYATQVAAPPMGCTWGTFGGVLEEINTGLPRLRLDLGVFKALRN